jgi:hypothetical protein
LKRCHKIENLVQLQVFSFVKGVFGVAVVAAEITEGQPDKDTTVARPGALALDRLINLVNGQRFFSVRHWVLDVGRWTLNVSRAVTKLPAL